MPRARGPAAVLLGAVLAGLVVLAVLAARDRRGFDLRIPGGQAVALAPGKEACRTPIKPQDPGANRLAFGLDSGGRPSPRLDVRVRMGRDLGNRPFAKGRLERGGPRTGRVVVPLTGSVAGAYEVSACVKNVGPGPVVLNPGRRPPAPVRGPARIADFSVTLSREPDRSLLALVPSAFRRAELFKPGFFGPWTFWLLVVLLAAGVPLLLARALALAERED